MDEKQMEEGEAPEGRAKSKLSSSKRKKKKQGCSSLFSKVFENVIMGAVVLIGGALFLSLVVVFVLLGFAIGIAVCLSILTIMMPVMTSLLLITLLATRLVQSLGNGEENVNVIQVKHWARLCLGSIMSFNLILMGVFKLFVITISTLKHAMIVGVPLSKWIDIVCMICGFHILSYPFFMMARLMVGAFTNGYDIPEAVIEIVDCLIFWWAEYEVVKRVPTFQTHELLGLKTHIWIKQTLFILIGINVITLFTHFLVWSVRKGLALKCTSYLEREPLARDRVGETQLADKVHPRVAENQSPLPDKTFESQSSLADLDHPEIDESQLSLADQTHPEVRESQSLKVDIDYDDVKQSFIDKVIPKKYILYYVDGMRANISFLLTSVMVLLTWSLYFGPRLSGTSEGQSVVRFVTWTFLSLVIYSFLCMLKTIVLLSWEVNAIYSSRLMSNEILLAGKQLYFLGIIARHQCDILNLLHRDLEGTAVGAGVFVILPKILSKIRLIHSRAREEYRSFLNIKQKDEVKEKENDDNILSHVIRDTKKFWKKLAQNKRQNIRSDLLSTKYGEATMYEVMQVARTILSTRHAMSNDTFIPRVLQELKNPREPANTASMNFKQLIDDDNNAQGDDYNELCKLAKFTDQSTYQDFQSWMEESRDHCLLRGNILSSAKEVVECLNKIISWVLIGGIFIMWLILTGLADTKVLVLIASPLLAATFIFGDTCKSFFQGIMFIYVVHPFNIGDLCAIDNKLMKVKFIGVWKTTFSNVVTGGGQEEVMYPNSELATKVVINHKSDFDYNDYVQFNVGDLCTIDDKLMEVKSIGVWKTIFLNVDKSEGQEEVIYPNSELANKVVKSHKSGFNCSDYIQFQLEFKDDEKIEILISKIKERLNCQKDMFIVDSHSVALLTTEEYVKITVRFQHKINVKEVPYSVYLITKEKQRTDLILYMKKIVKELTNGPSKKAQDEAIDLGDL